MARNTTARDNGTWTPTDFYYETAHIDGATLMGAAATDFAW